MKWEMPDEQLEKFKRNADGDFYEPIKCELDPRPFTIGQIYEDLPARRLRCVGCGGTTFEVGQGDYYTAIRCPVCGWEKCAHEG